MHASYNYLFLLLFLLFGLKGTNATALTYNVQANEEACFYIWADKPGKKLGFYFAVNNQQSLHCSSINFLCRYNKVVPLTLTLI